MTRRTIVSIIVLLLIIAGVIWLVNRKQSEPATPVLSISAYNQTKNADATTVTASPDDIVMYTLTAENQSDKTIPGYVVEAQISEITDKATLTEASGASYNSATDSLVWTPLDIPANDSITKQFTVRVNPTVAGSPSTAMKIKFNNELVVSIAPQQVAGSNTDGNSTNGNYKAPKTGPSESLPIFLALGVTTLFVIRKKLGITASEV